ncbi:hypothetical protein DR950_11540 [Kitasatospora xanthocidica]|uniref:Uncharacterized protein n=1 Tax=Kitasatospora xanthocidica TaxID=83382 RepID=A0A372ZSY9_9ACTN|nr:MULTISPECIES: hypothetical protein [Kitasatospora]RGD58337.1 hypothetical protein DR950_11540 [Kitasatospora xanthocidica]
MGIRSRGHQRGRRDQRERDQAPPPERYGYLVTYAVRGEPGARRAEVTVLPGYSQEDDIPRILAARLTGRPADEASITVLDVRPI